MTDDSFSATASPHRALHPRPAALFHRVVGRRAGAVLAIARRHRSGDLPVGYDLATDREVLLADPLVLLAGGDDALPASERARRERAREQAGGIVGYARDAATSVVAFALSGRLFVVDITTARRTRTRRATARSSTRARPDRQRVPTRAEVHCASSRSTAPVTPPSPTKRA